MYLGSVSKLIEPKEGSIGASHLQPGRQKPSDNLNWTLAAEVGQGGSPVGPSPSPLGSDAISVQVV